MAHAIEQWRQASHFVGIIQLIARPAPRQGFKLLAINVRDRVEAGGVVRVDADAEHVLLVLPVRFSTQRDKRIPCSNISIMVAGFGKRLGEIDIGAARPNGVGLTVHFPQPCRFGGGFCQLARMDVCPDKIELLYLRIMKRGLAWRCGCEAPLSRGPPIRLVRFLLEAPAGQVAGNQIGLNLVHIQAFKSRFILQPQ